ncbi:MAG: hypothetical protein KDK97_17410 [Verrucomicrobiales bacterium]|nr:hypothetical protein [Verrucomicrobiales bacterium]MCP5557310.1 hypothetical protein [Verrucomicrobiaceae bacterium]
MKQFFQLIALVGCLFASACTSTIPSAASLDQYDQELRARARPQYEELERQRASGTLTQEQYLAQKQAMDATISQKATDLAWSRHALDQSQRKAGGLPTPDQPINLSVPTPGQNGESLYRAFNQQYGNATGGNQNMNGLIPTVGRVNNASTMYVSPAVE